MLSTRRPLSPLLVAALASAGCYTTSPSMQSATAALKVNGQTQEYDAYIDSSFNYHEAGSHYVFESFTVGQAEVDELTFYHVAGDQARADEIVKWRKAANTAALAGWSITAAGIGAAGAGAGLLFANRDDIETFVTTPLGQASLGLAGVGGIVVGLAFYSWSLFGPDRTLNEHDLVFDPATEGEEAARNANARMAGGSPAPDSEAAPTE